MTFRVPFRDPLAVGIKLTVMLQLAPGARVLPQVVLLKSPGLLPVRVMLVTDNTAYELVLVFVSMAVWGGAVCPTVVLGNVMVAGVSVTVALGTVPVPVRVRVCDPALILSVRIMDAGRDIACVGLNVTV